MFIYFWERERDRQSTSGGRAEREEDTESEAGSMLQAVSTEPVAGLKPMNCEIVTWAKVGHPTNWTDRKSTRLNSSH